MMEKNNIHVPLLIGGATTSRVHTAVKIEKELPSSATIHVLDASRSVPVAGSLLGNKKQSFINQIHTEYEKLRANHFKKKQKKEFILIEEARKNKFFIDWQNYTPIEPKFKGVKTIKDLPVNKIVDYIDWTPFFQTWELHGRYPKILDDEIVGKEATKLFKDAQNMMDKALKNNWLNVKVVFGLWSAFSDEKDDIYILDENENVIAVSHTLRQQSKKSEKSFNMALSDFIIPKSFKKKDYIGAFTVTAGENIDEISKKYLDDLDDYNSIMIKALADRMAEASAEYLHELIRKKYWGYSLEEDFTNEDLIREKYKGIRPAPGYPACPDHTEKETIFRLLNTTENIGVSLTESLAMYPVSSVSGWYFANPNAKYFGLGKIKMDQVEDLSKRKKVDSQIMKKWLSPNLED